MTDRPLSKKTTMEQLNNNPELIEIVSQINESTLQQSVNADTDEGTLESLFTELWPAAEVALRASVENLAGNNKLAIERFIEVCNEYYDGMVLFEELEEQIEQNEAKEESSAE